MMNHSQKFLLSILLLTSFFIIIGRSINAQGWTHYVRIAGHGLSINDIHSIMEDAVNTHLSGFEVDNDITGQYQSLLNPSEKLKAIHALADSAHAHHDHAFVYIAGLECITNHADTATHSLFRDHPDWVQRNINDQPAIFKYGDAFWIGKGDEDAWISPYAPDWRKLYMKRIRQIAATGIDGIYVDIPYWMTHYSGWENTWASFDKFTVRAFKEKAGINALKDFKLGDWENPAFVKWVNFRIESITDFIKEIKRNIKTVNPHCKLILEIFPGLDTEVPVVGTDNYQLSQVADVITHEYNPGDNSVKRTPFQWMQYMIAMFTFRAFAGTKPTWMLSYSWNGSKEIQPADAMKNLFASQVTAGANSWDASRFVMSGSNDFAVRSQVYNWIKDNEKLIYDQRVTISPIGVYFSPKTRDYFTAEWREAYMGAMETLLQHNMEFEIVTPRTLSATQCKILILPDVKCVSNNELSLFHRWLKDGKWLILTGRTGYFNQDRQAVKDSDRMKNLTLQFRNAISFKGYPFIELNHFLKINFDSNTYLDQEAHFKNSMFNSVLDTIQRVYRPVVSLRNVKGCISQVAKVHNKTTVFIVNYSGIKSGENAIPIPKRNVTITFNNVQNQSDSVEFLPFLGTPVIIKGTLHNHQLKVKIPSFLRGAIIIEE